MKALFKRNTRSKKPGAKPDSLAAPILFVLFSVLVFCYLTRLEAHTRADIFLPADYSILDAESGRASPSSEESGAADPIDAPYARYTRQESGPYTVRQEILLSRFAYIKAPQGFRGERAGVTVRELCDEVARALGEAKTDAESVFGREREELLAIINGICEQSLLGGLVIREYVAAPSGLAGYVLGKDGELTMALRGTDDAIDQLDNALLLPFNLSVQYADLRGLLKKYGEAKRIWLTGHSKGGHNAIYAASIDPRCRATGFNAPGFGIFLSDAQHDGLDFGVNYVINGDVTGFLLFHLERRVVLETPGLGERGGLSLNDRHRLNLFFSVDDLLVAEKIHPLSIWSEWITQILWLLLIFFAGWGAGCLLKKAFVAMLWIWRRAAEKRERIG
ncbi:MAG: DUF2974 domain-containing protein [Christensenellaceae bacterium]|jgi:hypothetical protein|nr:DUF2974 domain-containing protein [Christensenellaceae bacterium]